MLVTQLCLTLCDPMDCSPSSPSVHGIAQARILGWVIFHWRGTGGVVPFPSSGNLPNSETELGYPVLRADSLLSGPPGKQHDVIYRSRECLVLLAISWQVLERDRPGKYLELGMGCGVVSGRRKKNGLEETTKTSEEHVI